MTFLIRINKKKKKNLENVFSVDALGTGFT